MRDRWQNITKMTIVIIAHLIEYTRELAVSAGWQANFGVWVFDSNNFQHRQSDQGHGARKHKHQRQRNTSRIGKVESVGDFFFFFHLRYANNLQLVVPRNPHTNTNTCTSLSNQSAFGQLRQQTQKQTNCVDAEMPIEDEVEKKNTRNIQTNHIIDRQSVGLVVWLGAYAPISMIVICYCNFTDTEKNCSSHSARFAVACVAGGGHSTL